MKKKLQKLIVFGLAVSMMVAATVMGTIAYLTDTQEVTNTFTVGKVDIWLHETDVDLMGQPVGNNVHTGWGNQYHLLPGQTYTKDPTVTVVNGSEESYIRLIVEITDLADVKAVFGEDFLPQNFVEGWEPTVWVSTGNVTVENNTATYEFRYKEAVKPDGTNLVLPALFQSFTVPGTVTGPQLATLTEMKIKVTAHAIQTATFDSADAAWAAFDAQINA